MNDPEAVLAERAQYTRDRLAAIRLGIGEALSADEKNLVIGTHTCIYATGSGGRLELSPMSDLDAFILRDNKKKEASNLDAVLIQSAVLRTSRSLLFPDPSRDGEFLRMHTVAQMLDRLGTPEDDAGNTFTARMLLLLESQPLYGDATYLAAVEHIVAAYWRHGDEHPDDYLPLVLLNDIIRYWRIVLLNYEAKNTAPTDESDAERDADRRLRSYKLRFSRCLICYSAIAFLLGQSRAGAGNVERANVVAMVKMTPLERLQTLASSANAGEQVILRRLRELYAGFLMETAKEKVDLLARFGNAEYRTARSHESREFGDSLFGLLQSLGDGNPLYRFVLV